MAVDPEAATSGDDAFMLVTGRDAGSSPKRVPLVVALHARGGTSSSAIARARELFGPRPEIAAPQAARPCNPFQSNLASAPSYAGFSWYLGDDPERPEPASFGDALAQIDAFVRRIRRRFVLFGEGQGAALALSIALHAPRHLLGVVAIGAGLPWIRGWEMPEHRLNFSVILGALGPVAYCDTMAALKQRHVLPFFVAERSPTNLEEWLCLTLRRQILTAHA